MSELTTVDSRDRQMNYIRLSELHPLELRDIRQHIVDDIAERISNTGYNPARPMRVVPDGDGYGVVDGNHRLAALRQLEDHLTPESVPCVVEPESVDVYAVSHASNQDEDTYAEEDLFDHLDFIADLRDEHTQAEIAERLGWSESKVHQHSRLLNEILTDVLELAKSHQDGRVSEDLTSVRFSEYWFRNSGLYDLNRDGVDEYAKPDEDESKHAQLRAMEWFVDEKNCGNGRGGGQIAEKAEKIKQRCEQLELLEDESNVDSDAEGYQDIKNGIVKGAYSKDSLKSAIENLNAEARDTAAFGTDALEGLENLDANSVDCVITDPPYGVGFVSHEDSGTHEYGIELGEYIQLLHRTCRELDRVCKDNAHIYIFFAMKNQHITKAVLSVFFDVIEVPLIWYKNNSSPSREKDGYEKRYAQWYDAIFFCRMPNGRSRSICPEGEQRKNVLEYDRPSGDDRWHDSQKPRPLLRDLITNSTGPSETVLDPFAGSGSTLLAAKASGRHYKGFELSEEPEPKFKKQLREVKE